MAPAHISQGLGTHEPACPVVKAAQEVEVETTVFPGTLAFLEVKLTGVLADYKVSYHRQSPQPPVRAKASLLVHTSRFQGGVTPCAPMSRRGLCNMKAGQS